MRRNATSAHVPNGSLPQLARRLSEILNWIAIFLETCYISCDFFSFLIFLRLKLAGESPSNETVKAIKMDEVTFVVSQVLIV